MSLHEGVALGGVIESGVDLGFATGDFAIDGGLDLGIVLVGGSCLDVRHFTRAFSDAA